MKFLFSFLFLFSLQPCFGQKELFLTGSAGWKVSYNQLISDKPLPKGIVRASRFSGFSSATGIEYKFSPHWAVHLQVKTATVAIGVRTRAMVLDTASGKYRKDGPGGSSGDKVGHAPAHIQLGGTYFGKPFARQKLSWFFGGGVAYLIHTDGFTPPIGIGLVKIIKDSIQYDMPGKFMILGMEREFRKPFGILLNVHTGLDFHFAPNHHLFLTLQQNKGLVNFWQFKSNYFAYLDIKPDQTITYEQYKVKIRTKGSYTALQLGYKYALTGRKKS